jgi:hypothetical protein
MGRLIITADDTYVTKLKSHLEKEHPTTKGKMKLYTQDKVSFKLALKDQIKRIGEVGGRILKETADPLEKIDKDMKKAMGKYY